MAEDKKKKEINFQKIEKKWQKRWEDKKLFNAEETKGKKKFYILEMFPYPSGSGLHMGHAFNYIIGDIFARFKWMQGFNVLHPMGYDALGLPAENAAIKDKTHPREYTNASMKNFMNQQKKLGLTYDWTRVVNTADPDYYKWDQWIFLKMFEKGLVYEKEASVNWCPKCNTIISNEQAQGGECERCGSKVEIRQMKQWFLKITDYAERLLEGHKKLNWPEKTIAMQKNWIGKSHGTEIYFEVETPAYKGCTLEPQKRIFPVFTTRPDTLYGVTFMVISAQHPHLMNFVSSDQEKPVEKFIKKLKSVSEKDLIDMEKEGVFTGSYAINPITNEKVPIYAGNFVIADYGSGMVMAVPAHDQRDFEFAKKYKIEIKQVIEGKITNERAYTESGELMNSENFNNLSNEEAKKKITDYLISKNLARRVVNFKLRDWSVARQRYWGTPIPLVHCEKCGIVPVNEKDLPVILPKKVKFGKGNPLLTNEEWLNTKCPKCKGNARREANTLDTFVNSSWYFLRYCDPWNKKEIFKKENVRYWMPVDLYIGGAEHTCMHLIYCRFYTMFLHDLGLIDFDEPVPRLFHQGMINDEHGEKMSKSKGNIIEPLKTMEKYGVDTTRFFMMSEASPDNGFNWSEQGIRGSLRFINKVFDTFEKLNFGKDSQDFLIKLNNSVKNISLQIENMDYRKSTIELRQLFDIIFQQKEISKESFGKAIKLLSPFCPHITEELWKKLGHKDFISISEWPEVDDSKLKLQNKKVDLNEKYLGYIKDILGKYEGKGTSVKKVYVYVVPFELINLNKAKIEKGIGRELEIFSVKDEKKYDPESKSKKAVPGMPGIYFE
jgi:leucyl-tRNA synthetase